MPKLPRAGGSEAAAKAAAAIAAAQENGIEGHGCALKFHTDRQVPEFGRF